MPSNNTGRAVKDLSDRFPDRIAHLFAPGRGAWRRPFLDYAVDNGAWGMRDTGSYPHSELLGLFAKIEAHEMEWGHSPTWVAVPDVPFDAKGTLARWKGLAPYVRDLYLWKTALVVQDGMSPEDVWALDVQPDVIFVGGSTFDRGRKGWKWDSLPLWCACFPRVHVGRVNSPAKLQVCFDLGVESVDGTGWTIATDKRPNQFRGLVEFLARTSSVRAA
jgi:hypothetical protein